MKKQYMKPALEQVVIETERMMAGSDPKPSGISLTGETTLNNISATNGGSAMSKQNAFDLWAEDEE